MPSRSPHIFWLLLAATASVDAVAAYGLHSFRSDRGELYSMMLFHSLATSQLSLIAVWCVFAAPRRIASLLLPCAAVAAAAFVLQDKFANFADYATWYGSHSLVLLLVLWQLRRTSMWQRLRREPLRRPWRFSLAHVVLLMTVVAVLLVFGRYANILPELPLAAIGAGFFADIALAVAATVIFATSQGVVVRFAMLAAVAIATGWSAVLFQRWIEPMAIESTIVPGYLIQAFVLAIWLQEGSIMPREHSAGDDAKQPAP